MMSSKNPRCDEPQYYRRHDSRAKYVPGMSRVDENHPDERKNHANDK